MTRVMLVAHLQRAEASSLAQVAASWLAERGHEVWMPAEDAHHLGLAGLGADVPAASADVVVSLGGDGTVLRAVQLLAGAPVPIIGVNVGVLGYLTEVEPHGMLDALEAFLGTLRAGEGAGDLHVEERMMLDVEVCSPEAGATRHFLALNEGVLEKLEPGHTVRLLVSIDRAAFTSYAADGLIVATPTGSTAYSLSARGPVVSPRHRAILVTPVSPHMLFDRSLVLDPDEEVEVEVGGHRPVVLTIDGQRAATLDEGDVVRFTSAASTARFVRFGRHRFHRILKSKFGLADR